MEPDGGHDDDRTSVGVDGASVASLAVAASQLDGTSSGTTWIAVAAVRTVVDVPW